MTGMSLNRDVHAAFMHNFIEKTDENINKKSHFVHCFVKIKIHMIFEWQVL